MAQSMGSASMFLLSLLTQDTLEPQLTTSALANMQARNMSLPTGSVYVAEGGFLLERAQVTVHGPPSICTVMTKTRAD